MKICWNPATRSGCRTQNRDAAKFCMKCGRRLENVLTLLNPGELFLEVYEIKRIVGAGSAGAVYLVLDQANGGVERALKEIDDPFGHDQFDVVADVLRPLSHPNLPRMHGHFSHGGRDYLVMDFVPGRSLGEVLAERAAAEQPPLDEQVVIGYAIQICRALEYLHSRDPHPVIHRDIKPDNIRITPHGELRLVDFGLMKRLDATNPSTQVQAHGLTPIYASPEQWGLIEGLHTDPRSDIYSLAATLYHLLTGRGPVSALKRLTASRGRFKAEDPLVLPRAVNPAVSVRAQKALVRALAFDPDERFVTAREFRGALSVGTDTLRIARRPVGGSATAT